MSQPVKNHVSNNHDGLAILRESATPDIYRKNGFRILELPVDVGAKEINSRTRLLEMAFRQHAELNSQPNAEAQDSGGSSTPEAVVLPPGRGRYFPLAPAPDQFAIRDAVQRLGDPERRLVDEFFWFWPHSQGESAKDAALTNLREDKNKEAEGIWLEQESEQSESSVSTHNLAVLYHFMALEWENYNRNGELAEEDKNNIEKLWKRAYRRWAMLLNEEGFWSRLNARIREIEDPRLTAETASRIRRSLPAALLSVSARLALHAVEEKRKESASRLVDSIRNSGFSEADITEGLRLAVEPVRNRIKALCKAAEDSVVADPIHADKTCRQLLDSTIPLLNGLDCLLPGGNPTRDLAHDDVAEQALKCQVAFAKKTNNWKISVELLEAAATVAASESVIKTLKENVETVKKNASNNDDFCGEGYYDLPAPVLEELEAARKHADSQDFDGAVSRIEKLASGGGSVVVEPSHLLLINKALAYCLGFRAIKRINESMAEWNAHKPSTITNIQKRADSIDNTSWTCAGMEQIPQYVNCRCMACGSMITGRYTIVKWTFKDKPVSLIICGSCGDQHRRELDSARSKIKGAIKQSAQDFVDAGQLDSANKFVQGQIERVRKMCSDSEVPFPSPSKQSKKAAKQQAAPRKPRTETPASGTSGRTAECAEAKKSLNWGIASLLFGVLAAIPAVIYGHKALRKIKQSNGTLGGRAKAQAGLVIGYAIIIITAVMIWYLAVEQPAQEKISFEEAVTLAQQKAAAQKSAEDKAKADTEAARLAEEKRKADELTAQKAADQKTAQELAAKQAADEKAKSDAEAARLTDEKRKADELVAQKAIEEKNTQPENVNSIGQTAQNQSDTVPSSQQFITADSNTSYALGMMLANNWAKQRLKLLSDDITAGIKDVLNGNTTRFNREEMKSTITAFQAQIRQRSSQSLTEADANTSYAIGMALADNWNKQQLKVQLDDLIAGTKDVINGNATRLSQTEMQTTIAAFQTQFKQQALEIRSDQARQNAIAGNAFLGSNKMRSGVVTLPSGLQYEIITTGSGDRPALNDTVTVNYRGTLVDGTEFDSSYKRGQPAQFPVSSVIRGWTEALQVMNVGSKWKLFIPPDLAYGEQGRPGIPPDSVLIFEVELLSVKAQQNVNTTTQPLTGDIIKVPSADEMKRGAKIEVVQGTMTTDTTSTKTTVQIAPTTTGSTTADTSIYDAARDGDLEKVKTLLKNDPNLVFSKNGDGWTPLHFAAAFGHKDMVELLLANKADVNAKNNGDWTPLRYAVENGHTDVAELLRQNDSQSVSSTPTDAMKSLFGDPIIVKANDFTIKQSALDEVMTGAKANAAAQGQQLPSDFQVSVLNQLITIQLLLQKATDADRAAGKAEADLQFQNILTRFGSTAAFERQLKAVGMTADELRAKATQEAVAKAVLVRELNITDTDTVVRNSKVKNLAPDYVKKLRATDDVEILDPVLKAQAERLGSVN